MTDLSEKFRDVNSERFRQEELDNMVYEAVAKGSDSFLKLALAAGGNPDGPAPNQRGQDSPLARAIRQGDPALVWKLLDAGANPNISHGVETPLMLSVIFGHNGILDMLIKKKADVNAQSPSGMTALSAAVNQGSEAAVERLLAEGADATLPWTVHGFTQTPLEAARKWAEVEGDIDAARHRVLHLLETASKAKPSAALKANSP